MRAECLDSRASEQLNRLTLRNSKQSMNEFLPRAHSCALTWNDSQMRSVIIKRPARDQTFLLSLSVPFAARIRSDLTKKATSRRIRSKAGRWNDSAKPKFSGTSFQKIRNICPGSKMIIWAKIKLWPNIYFILLRRGGDEEQVQEHMFMQPSWQIFCRLVRSSLL